MGPRTFGNKDELIFLGKEIQEERNYSEKTAEEIDQQVSKFINAAYKVSEGILTDKKPTLDKLVAVLLERETIEQEEFNAIVGIKSEEKIEEKKEAQQAKIA